MRLLFYAFALVGLFSCNTSDERLPLLYGEWKGVEWSDGSNMGIEKAAKVKFVFNEDFTYTATYGGQEEAGSFVFRESKLYTTATGDRKVEKVVGVLELTNNRLVFDMNRAGNPEKLVLERQ